MRRAFLTIHQSYRNRWDSDKVSYTNGPPISESTTDPPHFSHGAHGDVSMRVAVSGHVVGHEGPVARRSRSGSGSGEGIATT